MAPHIASRPAPQMRQMHVQQRQERVQFRAQQREQRIQLRQQNVQKNLQTRQVRIQQRTEQRQQLATDRRQLRDLQTKQRQELRAKNLTPAERRDLRTQQAKQLQDLRMQQRDQRRLATQPQQLQGEQQNQRTQALRANGQPRVSADAAKAGKFAGRFQNNPNWQARRASWMAARGMAARDAWRHNHRAVFVAWLGPLFYPYAYSDIFEYTFWPYAYDDGYWAYAYDDFIDSMFWAEAAPYSDYAYAAPGPRSYSRSYGYTTGSAPSGSGSAPRSPAIAQVCTDPGKGITAWPFAQIEQAVRPTAEQQTLLEDLKRAAADAANVFKTSCEENFPLTPPGRLAAMNNRLDATLQAVRTVRPALEAFYNSLSDEQKARFTAIGPDNIGASSARAARNNPQQQANNCGGEKLGLTTLPIERIEDAVRPTDQQQSAFATLDLATRKAVEILAAACPDEIALTPVGRLEAMEKRLAAMVDAGKTVQPALAEFYATLSNEQKARFNALGQQAERGQ